MVAESEPQGNGKKHVAESKQRKGNREKRKAEKSGKRKAKSGKRLFYLIVTVIICEPETT